MQRSSLPGIKLIGTGHFVVIISYALLFVAFMVYVFIEPVIAFAILTGGLIVLLPLRIMLAVLESAHNIITLQAQQYEKIQEMLANKQQQ